MRCCKGEAVNLTPIEDRWPRYHSAHFLRWVDPECSVGATSFSALRWNATQRLRGVARRFDSDGSGRVNGA